MTAEPSPFNGVERKIRSIWSVRLGKGRVVTAMLEADGAEAVGADHPCPRELGVDDDGEGLGWFADGDVDEVCLVS
jgi:hypothetical protein